MEAEAEKPEPADSEPDEEEDVYEVERIIDMRVEEVRCRANWLTWLAMLSSSCVDCQHKHRVQPVVYLSLLFNCEIPATAGLFVVRVIAQTYRDRPLFVFTAFTPAQLFSCPLLPGGGQGGSAAVQSTPTARIMFDSHTPV